MNKREKIQNDVGRYCEEMMVAMLEIAKENYLSGKSQHAINEYSSAILREAYSIQLRVPFLSPSEQEDIFRSFKGGR